MVILTHGITPRPLYRKTSRLLVMICLGTRRWPCSRNPWLLLASVSSSCSTRRKPQAKIVIVGDDISGRTCLRFFFSIGGLHSYGSFRSLFSLFHAFYSFVTLFWPKKVKAAKLEEIHAKMVMKESGPRSTPSEPHPGIPKKPRLGTSVPNMPAIVVAGGRSNGAIQSSRGIRRSPQE